MLDGSKTFFSKNSRPTANADLKVSKGAPHRGLPDATLRSDPPPRRSPSTCSEEGLVGIGSKTAICSSKPSDGSSRPTRPPCMSSPHAWRRPSPCESGEKTATAVTFFFYQYLGACRRRTPGTRGRSERYLKTRLTETFPTLSSDSI